MSKKSISINRRALIAAGVATVLLPSLAKAQQGSEPASQRTTDMKIRMTFDGQTMTATLYDNPSARDFYSMLPLDLTIEDFGHNEKIAHLPRKLTEEGSGPFGNEQPYDLCYFKPWGNLRCFMPITNIPVSSASAASMKATGLSTSGANIQSVSSRFVEQPHHGYRWEDTLPLAPRTGFEDCAARA